MPKKVRSTLGARARVLVVDDDQSFLKTISSILQAEGYLTRTATTAQEALKEASYPFDILLLDVKLPDMDGIKLLERLQRKNPNASKIILTGYPTLPRAVNALNLGANSFVVKPIDPAKLLKLLAEKMDAKREAETITQGKVTDWVKVQIEKKHSSNFETFLGEKATELTAFGLTSSQAKVYLSTLCLGVSSASQIANLSKIRREEIYRIAPKLEQLGLVTMRLGKPRKFSASEPKRALSVLVDLKRKKMDNEIKKLRQDQVNLITQLESMELRVQDKNPSIETIYSHNIMLSKIREMAQATQKQIDAVTNQYNLELLLDELQTRRLENIFPIRAIIENQNNSTSPNKIAQSPKLQSYSVKIKSIPHLPFHLIIADGREAIWGERPIYREKVENLWTNSQSQINILTLSFENLWSQLKS